MANIVTAPAQPTVQQLQAAAPEPQGEAQEGEFGQSTVSEQDNQTTPPSESQGPDLGECLTILAAKGWPVEKLEIKFLKKSKDWGNKEWTVIADMAADTESQ